MPTSPSSDFQPERLFAVSRPSEWRPFFPVSRAMLYKMARSRQIVLTKIGSRSFIAASEISRVVAAGGGSR